MRLQLRLPLLLGGLSALIAAADAAPPAPGRPRPALMTSASFEIAGYTDSDHVQVATPTLAGAIADPSGTWSVGARYLVDAVSAASVDVVATASPRFDEIRHAGSVQGMVRRGDWTTQLSGALSREPDYLSGMGAVTVGVDLRDRTVSPLVGVSFGVDEIGRLGQARVYDQYLFKYGLQAGALVVLNRSAILGVVADLQWEEGNQSKPYRYVPLFAPGTAADVAPGASVDDVNGRRLPERPRDRLPEARQRYAVSARLAWRLPRSTIRADQRLYRDSWALAASTSDLRMYFDVTRRMTLGPHLRFHAQQGVSFWWRAYELVRDADGRVGVPSLRTGDRELGPLSTLTGGLAASWQLGAGTRVWRLNLQADAMQTRFFDALYIARRRGLLVTVGLETALE